MKGIAVSKGVAIGKAYLLDRSKFCILKQKLEENKVEKEIERFRMAIEKTKLQMTDIKNQAEKIADKQPQQAQPQQGQPTKSIKKPAKQPGVKQPAGRPGGTDGIPQQNQRESKSFFSFTKIYIMIRIRR